MITVVVLATVEIAINKDATHLPEVTTADVTVPAAAAINCGAIEKPTVYEILAKQSTK